MRRKTKAQRILDYENEEDEEEEQKPDCFSNGAQKRRKMYSSKEKSEENSSSDAGLQKLDMKVNELDCSSADLYADSPPASESEQEAHYLQSYSKKELIAMVLCMQREMEDLKEQLRCLTACGKLARNLEMLIEKTQMWSNGNNGISLGTPVSQGTPQAPAEADAVIPDVRSPPAIFITPELLERCNTGTTAQKLTNDLLRGLYERECLASHSISGVVYNKRGQPKPALPTEEVQAILRTVQYFFPGKTDAEIKGYIRQKLQNEAKRLRKKPSLSGQYESRGLNLPLDMIDQN
ncbi:BEN domain-containing protein 6 [Labeo rohita]|uniref:BEN domain-containing protein 6 n=1 Tax=Labeo rohita TaxID=84645 RepID=A0ABQ8M677_LABRO|nr:BEN domain-containing protein 6 [Labeo rohita]